jgi:transcriptional regulator with XRE-family HTH domain
MRRLRKQHGVTAEGLAAYLGCSTAALRRLECGKARLSAWVVADYLKILGYDLVLVEIGS